MAYEYKVVPAPARGAKARGLKTTAARFAHALEALMNELGAEGWEYVRADTLPCEERKGLTGTTTTYQNLLVFRRALVAAEEEAPVAGLLAAPAPEPAPPAPDAPPSAAPPSAPHATEPPAPRPRGGGMRNPAPLVAGGAATRTDPRTGRAIAGGETPGGAEVTPLPDRGATAAARAAAAALRTYRDGARPPGDDDR
jgi:hypothetical protein